MSPRPSAGPAGADPAVTTPHGFDIVPTLSTRPQWFPCGPLPVRHLTWFFPGLFLLCSRPWLLTTAAGGGLEPAPASRFRGAVPHRLDSYALRRSFRSPSRSWRTAISIALIGAGGIGAMRHRVHQELEDQRWTTTVARHQRHGRGQIAAGTISTHSDAVRITIELHGMLGSPLRRGIAIICGAREFRLRGQAV